MPQAKKKDLRKLKVFLIISLSLVLGSVNASPSDWVQLLDTTDECYFCHTTYLVCKYAPLQDFQRKFNIHWRDIGGAIQNIRENVPNLQFSVYQNKTRSFTCPTDNFNYTLNPYPKTWCWYDNGTMIRYVEHFTAWDIPSKTVWWQNEEYDLKTPAQLKEGMINADVGTCKKVRISGTLREGAVDHFLEWVHNHTEYAWWAAALTPAAPYFNVTAGNGGGINSVYCRGQNFVKSGTETITHVSIMAGTAPTGNPAGGCTVAVHVDSGGSPGTALAWANFTDAQCETTSTNYTSALNESVTLTNGVTYWYTYSAKDSPVAQYYSIRRDTGDGYAGGQGKYGDTYSGYFCTNWVLDNDYNFMMFMENIAPDDSFTLYFEHDELNSSISHSNVNITVNASINSTVCNVTIDSTLYAMTSFNVTWFYYEWNDTTEGNHTYYANCTNGTRYGNTTSGWTYIDLPLDVIWDWDDINTTLNTTDSSTIYVNTTNATICIINFNHTNYTMTDLGDRWSYAASSLPNGNYSTIYVVCNDSLNNTNQTASGWLYINYTAPSNTTLTHNICPFFVNVGEVFLLWANYSTTDGNEITNGNVTITVGNDTYNLSWNGADELYKGNFSFTDLGTYIIYFNATAENRQSANSSCTAYVVESFNVTIRIWEEVEREVFARTNNTVITVRNYDVELIDPYINELGWIFLVNLDRNESDLYVDCNVPFAPGQDLLEILNWNNYFGDESTATLTDTLGSFVWCDKYWFRGEYRHGEANVTVHWPGNYSLIFVSGTVTFENEYAPPKIIHGGLTIPFGGIGFANNTNMELDLYVPHSELNWWSALTDGIFIFLALIFPLMLFVYLMIVGVGAKTAVAIAGAFPILTTLARMMGIL